MSEGYGNAVLDNAPGDGHPQSWIQVITMSGDVIEMDLPSTSTSKDVKRMLQTITSQPMHCSKLIFGADILSNGVVLSDLPKHQHVTISVAKVQHSKEASQALLDMANVARQMSQILIVYSGTMPIQIIHRQTVGLHCISCHGLETL